MSTAIISWCREPSARQSQARSLAIRRAFHAAVAITGTIPQAESAVMEAIEMWNPEEPLGEALLHGAIRAAIALRARTDASDAPPRTCFTWRIPVGVPTSDSPAGPMSEHHPAHEQIETLAYRLWRERGCPTDSPEADWLRAEHQVRDEKGPHAQA